MPLTPSQLAYLLVIFPIFSRRLTLPLKYTCPSSLTLSSNHPRMNKLTILRRIYFYLSSDVVHLIKNSNTTISLLVLGTKVTARFYLSSQMYVSLITSSIIAISSYYEIYKYVQTVRSLSHPRPGHSFRLLALQFTRGF